MAVKASDLVAAAREIAPTFYRTWYYGGVPMWWGLDGYGWHAGEQPDPEYYFANGVNCSDLVNYALQRCGLDAIGGTGAISDAIIDWDYFDPASPGVPGAVAVSPYEGPALSQQGHVLLYTGANSCIQALYSDGVTEKYSDAETVASGVPLTYYGLLPGVDYSEASDPGIDPAKFVKEPLWWAVNAEGLLVANGEDYTGGWYDTGYRNGDFSFHGPKET